MYCKINFLFNFVAKLLILKSVVYQFVLILFTCAVIIRRLNVLHIYIPQWLQMFYTVTKLNNLDKLDYMFH